MRYTACCECGHIFHQSTRRGRPFTRHPEGCPTQHVNVADMEAVARVLTELACG
jgi:hypothetical protein